MSSNHAQSVTYYECAGGGGQTFNAGIVDLNYLKAFFIEQSRDNFDVIKQTIDGNARAKGWLIFATHDVCDQPTRFGWYSRFFRKNSGLRDPIKSHNPASVSGVAVLLQRSESRRSEVWTDRVGGRRQGQRAEGGGRRSEVGDQRSEVRGADEGGVGASAQGYAFRKIVGRSYIQLRVQENRRPFLHTDFASNF